MDIFPLLVLLCICVVSSWANVRRGDFMTFEEWKDTERLVKRSEGSTDIERLEGIMASMARQIMMQQLHIEETTRTGTNSGIKQKRVMRWGTKAYDTDSHTGNAVMAIHNHENNNRTIGMGEFAAVLNGVEFRTRHNDYKLNMPHTTSTDYNAVEPIPYPDVPPSVLQQLTVEGQIIEMQKYFKAWADQDTSEVDYRPYFKPVISYMEGAWTQNSDTIDEPFDSDRHQIDAKDWFDLSEKIRFTGYTGGKSRFENYAYLPTKIMDLEDEKYPIFAQWNYRILCHPLKDDLPLRQFRVVDDLASRLSERKTVDEFTNARAARFELNPKTVTDEWKDNKDRYGLLDKLMSQIPGKDNYAGNLTDNAFNNLAYPYDQSIEGPLNTAYYHRWYRNTFEGASGQVIRNRGFSDKNIFMAQTSKENVRSSKVEDCKRSNRQEVCESYEQRWTYAIPLEIIYLTPLLKWNPYNLEFKDGDDRSYVTANGRNGGSTPETAFNGTKYNNYYQTPSQFFNGLEVDVSSADTARGSVGVLDRNGEVKMVHASGTRIVMPNIPGVGELRTRFPIAPVSAEGSYSYQELSAVKDILLNMQSFSDMLNEIPVSATTNVGGHTRDSYLFEVPQTSQDPPGLHHHTVEIGIQDFNVLVQVGMEMEFETSQENGHTHTVSIKYRRSASRFVIKAFDGVRVTAENRLSWDGHKPYLIHVLD